MSKVFVIMDAHQKIYAISEDKQTAKIYYTIREMDKLKDVLLVKMDTSFFDIHRFEHLYLDDYEDSTVMTREERALYEELIDNTSMSNIVKRLTLRMQDPELHEKDIKALKRTIKLLQHDMDINSTMDDVISYKGKTHYYNTVTAMNKELCEYKDLMKENNNHD